MELEAGVREALDKVHALGKQDGNEHAIVVRGGKEVFLAHGDAHSVEYKGAEVRNGDITVHNHPKSLNALSNVDIAQLFWGELDAVYCISEDGSVYRAERGINAPAVRHPRDFLDLTEEAIMIVMAESVLGGLHSDIDNVGGLHIGEAHWVNRMLHYGGLIQYSYELQPGTAAKVRELDERLKFPREFRV